MQTRLQSLIEAWTGTLVGFVFSLCLSAVVFPMFGHAFTLAQNFWITTIFTVASIARSYTLRRLFNKIHGKQK